MKAFFHTMGCKVNQYETQSMMSVMQSAGFSPAVYHGGDVGESVLVVNSCTVTAESDRKLGQLLRRLRRENPKAVLVVTGCMPQAFPELSASLDADIVLGNAARRDLPQKVEEFLRCRQKTVSISAHGREYEPLSIEEFEEHTRAFIKIEDGCDRFCSYCVIPRARGRVRSRSLSDLRAELSALAAKGYRETVLVGVNLTSYGQDLGLSLADAVQTACRTEGIERVRLGSLEPDQITPGLIQNLCRQPKLCPHFHLSLQSGCDKTLRAMNRRYTSEQYLAVCEALRAAFPGCAFTTDVMVGFPGETRKDFELSIAFVQKVGFAKAHVFPFSPRPGTRAAIMPDPVPKEEKTRRAHEMAKVCEASRLHRLQSMVGKSVEVLTETPQEGGVCGYTREYFPCLLRDCAETGKTVSATVTEVQGDRLIAVSAKGESL